ncbi:hypothetical protein AAZX31_08G061700 [Glycine max]
MSPPSILGNCKDGSEITAGENYADINWDELEFSLVPTDYMYVMKCAKGDKFSQGSILPYGNLEINPSAGILNYGQGIFEGLKAHRTEDGCILLFRPDENAQRMKRSADRLCMPSPSNDQFVNAVKQIVLANKRWVFISSYLFISNIVLPSYKLKNRISFKFEKGASFRKRVPIY